MLCNAISKHKPDDRLFEGPLKEPCTARSVQATLRRAVEKAKAKPFARVHTLRHGFATHLLVGGTNIRYPEASGQGLLSHASVKTREINTHHLARHGGIICKGGEEIKSPLDQMDFSEMGNRRNDSPTE
jgi:integrase/recombinase XerD